MTRLNGMLIMDMQLLTIGFLITVLFVCLYLYWRRKNESDPSASKRTTTRQSVDSTVQVTALR